MYTLSFNIQTSETISNPNISHRKVQNTPVKSKNQNEKKTDQTKCKESDSNK